MLRILCFSYYCTLRNLLVFRTLGHTVSAGSSTLEAPYLDSRFIFSAVDATDFAVLTLLEIVKS
jgi:hypothetical protein